MGRDQDAPLKAIPEISTTQKLCSSCGKSPCQCNVGKCSPNDQCPPVTYPDVEDLLTGLGKGTICCDACQVCLDVCGIPGCKLCANKLKIGYPPEPKRVFTWCEVRRHTKPNDCWLVAHGKVYNVSPFVQQHPGGANAILKRAGRDCTVDFEFHSSKSQRMWQRFEIGRLVACRPGCEQDSGSSCTVM